VLADSEGCRLWIAESGGESAGQVRVDIAGNTGTVSIAVQPEQRGHGVGTAMLQSLLAKVAADGSPARLRAVVRSDNAASLHAFAHAGFREVTNDVTFLELEWP
jgi:L-amino acid N-acyltransferase YncA